VAGELSDPIRERLAAAKPGNPTYQRDLSLSYDQLGDLVEAAGQGAEAERLFREALAIAEGLAAAEPGNPTHQRDLSLSYDRLGNLAEAAGHGAHAA
jgi:Flp pilus assembly protein TadD